MGTSGSNFGSDQDVNLSKDLVMCWLGERIILDSEVDDWWRGIVVTRYLRRE